MSWMFLEVYRSIVRPFVDARNNKKSVKKQQPRCNSYHHHHIQYARRILITSKFCFSHQSQLSFFLEGRTAQIITCQYIFRLYRPQHIFVSIHILCNSYFLYRFDILLTVNETDNFDKQSPFLYQTSHLLPCVFIHRQYFTSYSSIFQIHTPLWDATSFSKSKNS